MRIVSLFFILSVSAFAQVNPPDDGFGDIYAARREASMRLLEREKIELAGVKGGRTVVALFPEKGPSFPLKGHIVSYFSDMCWQGENAATFEINEIGWVTVITPGKFGVIADCPASKINIDPIKAIAGDFAYDPITKKDGQHSKRLYLK